METLNERSAVFKNASKRGKLMSAEIDRIQGTWAFTSLEVEGTKMPLDSFRGASIVVDGDRFTSVSMGAVYKGTVKLGARKKPKTIDLCFTEGPEARKTSLGIYELDGDTWRICLGMAGRDRPKAFATKPGSGHALESLKRAAPVKSSGTPAGSAPFARSSAQTSPSARSVAVRGGSPASGNEMEKLAGTWTMVSGELNGQRLPAQMIKGFKRVTQDDETTVTSGGRVFLKAKFRIDSATQPKTIDYEVSVGTDAGKTMLGIFDVTEETLKLCYASAHRPTDFSAPVGSGRSLTVWKREKSTR